MPDLVNGAITDSVTQANVKILGDAPAQALAGLYQAVWQEVRSVANRDVIAQQEGNVIHHAATTMGVITLYALGTATAGNAAAKNEKQ